ncbi:hypothetical protein EV359DRAFT_66247 [Lentinula novae-zelandiae]|nr:hypothetical protein EV359DRAFT_66247 [Lentinula novae-zelandiae]
MYPGCYASPLPESYKPSPEIRTWGRRDEPHRVHIGYRYVNRASANALIQNTDFSLQKSVLIYASAGRELAKVAGKVVQAKPKGDEAKWVIEGTLTNIRATGTLLGEGAYLTPNLGGWQGDFVFLAKEESGYLPFDDKAWDRMLSKHDKTMSQNTTMIAARIPGQYCYTMQIPPHYLKPSPRRIRDILTGQKKPKVDLGITVRCVSEKNKQALSIHDPANWEQWWPKLNPNNLVWMESIQDL